MAGNVGGYLAVAGIFDPASILSGAVGSGDLAPASVTSGVPGSGAVTGQAGGGFFVIASGTVTTNDLGSGAIRSGLVASGQLGTFHFASGQGTDTAEWLVDDTYVANETISGGRPVCFNQSGQLLIAMAAVSGRMPAVGVVASNYVSGAAVIMQGDGRLYSTLFNFSGWPNRPVYVGGSGDVVASGAPVASGNVQQIIGTTVSTSGLYIRIGDALEGVIAASGDIGSGAVTGAAGGGFFVIASGTVGSNDLGSGLILSGHLGSGQVSRFAVASGSFAGFELGSGAVVSGRIASGQVGFGHLANASVQSGSLASGNVARNHLASGLLQASLQIIVDGGGAAIASGDKGDLIVPFDCRINYVNVFSDQSGGSLFFGIWRDSYCVDEETEALTNSGWKRWHEIGDGDQLLAYSSELGSTCWQCPTGMYVDKNYQGPMVRIGSDIGRINALVTPNHAWPVVRIFGRDERRSPVERFETKDLPRKGLLLRSAPYAGGPSKPVYDDALVRIAAWCFTEGHFRPDRKAFNISQSERVNPDNCESIREDLISLGAFLSDGKSHTGKAKREGVRGGTCRRVGLWVYENPMREDGQLCFNVNGDGADRVLDLFESEGNKIPSWKFIKNLTSDQARQFVETSILGDGWRNGNVFTQHDSRRMDAFMAIAVLAGFSPSLARDGTTCSMRRNRPFTWLNDTPRGVEYYRGVVWCPTLPAGYWVARRAGKVFITGNSNYPPTSGDTIAPSGVPLISGAIRNSYSGTAALSGWTVALTKGDVLKFVVHSGATMTRGTVALQVGVGD